MEWDEFARHGRDIADWGAEYHRTLRDRPVRARTRPGEILAALPEIPPEEPAAMDAILADFDAMIMPGITHWQHPRFFAYFPANAAPPSMLAEMLAAIVAPQCMLWQTSPAATELETRVMDWLRQAVGLPPDFRGVIQDSASSATLAAVLTMRERALEWSGNRDGLPGQRTLRIYASDQTHSSVERAIWIAGIGAGNLVRIPSSGPLHGMDARALDQAVRADIAAGHLPCGIVACTGATGIGACDDVRRIAAVSREHGLYLHLDAAWAGAAMIVPEFRALWDGVDDVDSLVLNPHKWLGAQFDCSAHFLRAPEDLVRTLAIRPDYLRTDGAEGAVDYSEWSIPLGRRFRALKLWFLIRSYGFDDLRDRIRSHVRWARALAERLSETPGLVLASKPILSLFTFRVAGDGAEADRATERLLAAINDDGRIYLTPTSLDGRRVIRFQVGQFGCTSADIDTAYEVITEIAGGLHR